MTPLRLACHRTQVGGDTAFVCAAHTKVCGLRLPDRRPNVTRPNDRASLLTASDGVGRAGATWLQIEEISLAMALFLLLAQDPA
jgi:hypothetical protein